MSVMGNRRCWGLVCNYCGAVFASAAVLVRPQTPEAHRVRRRVVRALSSGLPEFQCATAGGGRTQVRVVQRGDRFHFCVVRLWNKFDQSWRKFIDSCSRLMEDFNDGYLVRIDSAGNYDSANTILGTWHLQGRPLFSDEHFSREAAVFDDRNST